MPVQLVETAPYSIREVLQPRYDCFQLDRLSERRLCLFQLLLRVSNPSTHAFAARDKVVQFQSARFVGISQTPQARASGWHGSCRGLRRSVCNFYSPGGFRPDTAISDRGPYMRKMFSLFLFLVAPAAMGQLDDLAITTISPLYNGTVGVPYLFLQFQAAGGSGGAPYSWDTADTLPPGLSLDPSGILAGTPTNTGAYSFSVRVTDSAGNQLTGIFTMNVYQSDNAYCNPGNVLIAPNGSMDGPAQLPQSCFFTDSSATPSPGNTTLLTDGQSLQAALNAAACGDVIELQAGASFNGNNVTFPAKNCDDANWITVRTSTPDSLLPPEGGRITPCWAGVGALPGRPPYSCPPDGVPPTSSLPQIVLSSNARLNIPGDHYRLIGLEITRADGGGPVSVYVNATGGSQVILDRLWIHGTAADESTHGITVNNAHHIALVDSYINDFHCTAATGTCTDAQTFSGANDSLAGVAGTFKVVDNFQEASGENILFGGGASVDVPGDIEVRRNYMFKPMIWNPSDPTFFGATFIVKNHYEMKNGVRALVEETSWRTYGAGSLKWAPTSC